MVCCFNIAWLRAAPDEPQRFEIQTKDTEAYTGTADLNGNTMPIQFKVPSHSLVGVRTASSALAQKIAQH